MTIKSPSPYEIIRDTPGVSVIYVAEQLGVRRQQVYRWERIPESYLERFCAVVGVRPSVARPDLSHLMRMRRPPAYQPIETA